MIDNSSHRGTKKRYRGSQPQTISQADGSFDGVHPIARNCTHPRIGRVKTATSSPQGAAAEAPGARKSQQAGEAGELPERRAVAIENYADLGSNERKKLRKRYLEDVYPLLTPQTVGPAHPFPHIPKQSLILLANLRHPRTGEPTLAYVRVPVGQGVPRLLKIGTDERFVAVEEVVADNLDLLFPGMEVLDCGLMGERFAL